LKKLRFIAPILLIVSLVLVACGGDDDNTATTPSVADGVTQVVRQILADANPDTAQGQVLQLTRVIIPAGEGIAPHDHPGPQLAIIVSGTLTYTVIDGEAHVTRAAATDNEEAVTYKSGDTFELKPGDSIMEPTKMVHKAANETEAPVIIYLSSLFPQDAPPATTVE
jgi:quercetin dioxygenase-like cupin family protein